MTEETDLMEKIAALQEEQIAADHRITSVLKWLLVIFIFGMMLIQLFGCDEQKFNPLIFPYYAQGHFVA